MEPLNPKYTVSYSWTQPYHSMNWEVYVPQETQTQRELERLEAIDREVAAMTEFPQVLELVERLK